MYKAMDLANYIVDKCIKDNTPITNLQLQRILYEVAPFYNDLVD